MDIDEELRKIEELKRYNNSIYKNMAKRMKRHKPKNFRSLVMYTAAAAIIGTGAFLAGRQATPQIQTYKVPQDVSCTAPVPKTTEYQPEQNSVVAEIPEVHYSEPKQTVIPETTNEEDQPRYSADIIPVPKEYFYFPLRGDTLSGIAKLVSDDSSNYPEIMRYNNINSHIIEVNQPIKIPEWMAVNTEYLFHGNLDSQIVMARSGDNIEDIALREFGTRSMAGEIINLNRQYNPRFSSRIWAKEYIFLPES